MQTVMFDNLETESQTHRKRRVNARENNTYLNTISSSSVVVLPFIPQTLFWFSWIFDFPGEPTRRRRGWITFTIRCLYRRYVKSVFVLSLHFFSCFLVWFVITIMCDASTSFLLQIETKTEKKKDQDINAKALQASDSKAESRFPSAVELVCECFVRVR